MFYNLRITWRSYTDVTKTATQGLIVKPKIKKSICRNNFTFLGPKLFNQLTEEIKQSNSTIQLLCKLNIMCSPQKKIII